MVNFSVLAFVASTLSAAVYAAPAATTTSAVPIPSGAAGVNFVPFAGPGCDMSTNPFDTTQPEVYVLFSYHECLFKSPCQISIEDFTNP